MKLAQLREVAAHHATRARQIEQSISTALVASETRAAVELRRDADWHAATASALSELADAFSIFREVCSEPSTQPTLQP